MTAAEALRWDPQPATASPQPRQVQLVGGSAKGGGRAARSFAPVSGAEGRTQDRERFGSRPVHKVPSWPLLILALPASVAVWSGWVGIGRMTGFGQVHPLPGIWDSFHINTAVTLPVGVEAYAAYALRAWLSASDAVSRRTRRFACWSAIGSLLLGMAGQVAYHLLTEAGTAHAPWEITTAVSCLPVLVLGMGAALAHLLHSDLCGDDRQGTAVFEGLDAQTAEASPHGDALGLPSERLAAAEAAAARLLAAGLRVSRRRLREAGIHGSNAELGVLAASVKPRLVGPDCGGAGHSES